MTDDAALHEAAIQLLARDEEERDQDLTEWARQTLSGGHLEGCPSVAMTCPGCLRENYEDDVRRIIDAYFAARDDARLAERERCAQIVGKWCRPDELRLQAGEMSAQEMRTVVAVLNSLVFTIRAGEGP